MNDCNSMKEQLVLYAERELSPDESLKVQIHLESCPDCREELAKLERIRTSLADPDLFLPETVRWEFLPQQIAARSQAGGRSPRWIPSNFGSWAWAASLGASFLLVVALIGRFHQSTLVPAVGGERPGNQEFVRLVESVHARDATARYLAECQDLILNVMRAEQSCTGEKYDVSLEIARARELLQRKRMLDPELRDPRVARAKELCDELETILMNLSTAETCESRDAMKSLEHFIQREQLLLRINLVRSELS